MAEAERETLEEQVTEEGHDLDPDTGDEPSNDRPAQMSDADYEEKALEMGWKPDGTDRDGNHVTAKEYVQRAPLYDRLHKMNDKLEQMTEAMTEVQGFSRQMAERHKQEKAGLLHQLKSQREQALDDLDKEEVRRLDGEIDRVQKEENDSSPQQQGEQSKYPMEKWQEAYRDFLKDNAWVDEKPAMASYAGMIGKQYMEAHPGAAPHTLYDHVAKKVREEFPDRFESKGGVNRVSGSTRRGQSSGKREKYMTFNELEPEEQRMVEAVASRVGKSVDEYMKNNKAYKRKD